jgi:hypothetical protein
VGVLEAIGAVMDQRQELGQADAQLNLAALYMAGRGVVSASLCDHRHCWR